MGEGEATISGNLPSLPLRSGLLGSPPLSWMIEVPVTPVSGLSKGSSVQYNGIKVGDVIELRLDDKDPRRVLARIRLAANTPVKVDTSVNPARSTGPALIVGGWALQQLWMIFPKALTSGCRNSRTSSVRW